MLSSNLEQHYLAPTRHRRSPLCRRLATIALVLFGSAPALAHAVDAPPSPLAPPSSSAPPEGAAPEAASPPAPASPTEPQPPATAPGPAKPRPPYSLPWQLRPALPSTVIRADVSRAIREDMNGNPGSTTVTSLVAAVQVAPPFAVFARVGVLHDTPPAGEAAASFLNPIVGATYSLKPLPELPIAFSLGFSLPVGMGGGNDPDPSVAAATRAGILARASMDNGLFAVNDFVIAPAVDIAYVAHGVTLQAEALLAQLIRVRGENFNPDSARTSATFGFHAGYFFVPEFSIGAELRHQRWLSTPGMIAADTTGTLRDTTSFAVGPRFNLNLGKSAVMRPGIVYMRGLDKPMTALDYHIVMLDLLIRFNFVATGARN